MSKNEGFGRPYVFRTTAEGIARARRAMLAQGAGCDRVAVSGVEDMVFVDARIKSDHITAGQGIFGPIDLIVVGISKLALFLA